jgi:arsenate reductase-like glutaredoxin family protein
MRLQRLGRQPALHTLETAADESTLVVICHHGMRSLQVAKLIGGHDYKLFLNPRNELYREGNMKEKPPSRKDAIQLMARNPSLIRRPIVVKGKEIVLGWDQAAIEKLV